MCVVPLQELRKPSSLRPGEQRCGESGSVKRGGRDSSPAIRRPRHGEAEQQAAAGGPERPAREHRVHRPRAAGVVPRLPEGLSHRPPDRGGVQEDLRQFLPLRRRLKVRRARLSHI